MLFSSFLSNPADFFVLLFVFFLLGFAAFYTAPAPISKGLKELFGGLLLCLFADLILKEYSFFTFYGVSFQVVIFLKLFLIIGGTLLFLMSSCDILRKKEFPLSAVFCFVSIGLLLIFYTVFIANSADIEKNISAIFPAVGLIYVFLAFASKPNLKAHTEYVFATLAVFGFIEQIALMFFLDIPCAPAFTLILFLILSASFFMIKIEFLAEQAMVCGSKISEFQKNIDNIIKASPLPIMISRLSDDTLLFANQNALKLFELNASEITRYHLKDFFVDTNNRKVLLEQLEHFNEVQDFEILVKSFIAQTPFWLIVSANVIEYQSSLALYCAFQDITNQKQRENALQNQANLDPLTAIYNRRYFEKIVPQKISDSRLKREDFAILMVDADHFKNINDLYGHKIGDKVLIEMAHILERSLRPEDVVARYGGEEFVVFLNNAPKDIAKMVAERLKESVAKSFVYNENKEMVTWTVSIGVAPCGISDDIGTMIKMADDAMYMAKQNGRNRVEVYSTEILRELKDTTEEKEQLHPLLNKEEVEEISLLDDI